MIGTATPCAGVEVYTGLTSGVKVNVRLRRGSKVVGRRLVTDTYNGKHNVDQPFMCTEPAERYLVIGPGGRMPVVVHPGKTTTATIRNGCF